MYSQDQQKDEPIVPTPAKSDPDTHSLLRWATLLLLAACRSPCSATVTGRGLPVASQYENRQTRVMVRGCTTAWVLVLALGACKNEVDVARPEAAPTPAISTAPGPPVGAELIGRRASPWQATQWANSPPLALAKLRGRVVVVRFWTDTCPFCERSLPAMQQLADEFKDQPVTFVGLFHSKPLGSEREWKRVVAAASSWGVRFALGYDHDWRTVKSWWLDGPGRRATSASFVIDPKGRILFVHPGPVFFQSDAPGDAKEHADYLAIKDAIRRALKDAKSDPS